MAKQQETAAHRQSVARNTTGFVAGQVGATLSGNEAAASDAMIEGMDVFRKIFDLEGGNIKKFGNLFECIEAAKFNADAAIKGSNLKAQVTAMPTNPSMPPDRNSSGGPDIVIQDSGKTVREVQAKCNDKAYQGAYEIKDSDYAGMQRVVPKDKEERVRELVESRAEKVSVDGQKSVYADDYQDAAKKPKSTDVAWWCFLWRD